MKDSSEKRNIVFFDFDGTITNKDSLLEIIKFHSGLFKFIFGFFLLSPILLLFKFKLIPNWRAKEIVLKYFFGGLQCDNFKNICERFSDEIIPKIIRPKATERLNEHINNGDKIYLVSASIKHWLEKWCAQHNLNLISTEIYCQNGIITGKLKGKNCYGLEKLIRIQEKIDLTLYDNIYVYGDSKGDKEMLSIATHPHYKPFI